MQQVKRGDGQNRAKAGKQEGFCAVWNVEKRKDAAALAGVTPWNWHKTYEEPLLQEVRYEFAQVFLERHSYTLPEQKPAEKRTNGQFTSPYQNWREQY
jgi:hypothetical protein